MRLEDRDGHLVPPWLDCLPAELGLGFRTYETIGTAYPEGAMNWTIQYNQCGNIANMGI